MTDSRTSDPIDCPTCGQSHVDEAAAELRSKLAQVATPGAIVTGEDSALSPESSRPRELLPSKEHLYDEMLTMLQRIATIPIGSSIPGSEIESLIKRASRAAPETRAAQSDSVITYDVVAYNESWGGYGDNASKDGFASAEEAIAYAKSCASHLSATAWQRTKPKPVTTTSVLLYDARAELKAAAPQMAMLPNDHHPGPRCSCSDCQRRYPENGNPQA